MIVPRRRPKWYRRKPVLIILGTLLLIAFAVVVKLFSIAAMNQS